MKYYTFLDEILEEYEAWSPLTSNSSKKSTAHPDIYYSGFSGSIRLDVVRLDCPEREKRIILYFRLFYCHNMDRCYMFACLLVYSVSLSPVLFFSLSPLSSDVSPLLESSESSSLGSSDVDSLEVVPSDCSSLLVSPELSYCFSVTRICLVTATTIITILIIITCIRTSCCRNTCFTP
jgi:hypothetical protein